MSRTLRQHLRCACSATESGRRSVVEFLGRSSESRHRVATSIDVSCSSLCSTPWDMSWLKRRSERLVSLAIESKTLEISLGGRDRPDFGTVRPRVQIPGPRPKIVFRIDALPAPPTPPCHQGGDRFSWNSVAAAPSTWITDGRLKSLTALAQPIYQHAHGPRTMRHLGSKIKGAVHAGVLPTHS